MRRSEAARYARWSAGVAIAVAAITLGVYLERGWVARRERSQAPPPAPPSVEKQSTALTFSKVEQNRTLFTVRASRSTEFKGNAEDLLEDVQITIFGRRGERHDTIHTRSCQYAKDSGRIACAGEVQMDLQSAADAERAAQDRGEGGRTLHVETRGVSFDRGSGVASTDELVKLVFANGEGQARGVEYRSEEGMVRFQKDVSLHVRRAVEGGARPAKPAGEQELSVSGTSLEYVRETRGMRLAGPVRAASGGASLTAGELALELDANYRAQRMVARPGAAGGQRPELKFQRVHGAGQLAADEMTARFDSGGFVTRAEGNGLVRGEFSNGPARTTLGANHFAAEFAARTGEPEQITATGGVRTESRAQRPDGRGMNARKLQTEALRLTFARGGRKGAARLETAETQAPGTITWEEAGEGESVGAAGAGRATRLNAENLQVHFQHNGHPGDAQARGNVEVQRTLPGRPEQTGTAREGTARFDGRGEWTEIVLRGDVKLREAGRRGQGETVTFTRGAQTAVLTGNAVASDAATRTKARAITFFQATGEIRAEGGVQTTDLSPRQSGVQLAQGPANISAARLQADSQTGRAVYTGRARLWQGDSVLEADSIELQRSARVLNASGNVRAVFPQAAFSPEGRGTSRPAAPAAGASPAVWHMQSETLSYREGESRARLEGKVFAQSTAQSIRAESLDLFFSRSGDGGGQQLSRAVATGGVKVTQGARRGTAERGDYTAADGKFVLSGGTPTLYDASSGTTTGRQLTFFLADDTILVDSENGSRTLTKHRVEK